jgi:hypothetical protein
MRYESKLLTCTTPYSSGYININPEDEVRVFYHFDSLDRPISIWAVKYDMHTNRPTYIVLLDKNRSDISNQTELNRILSHCQGHTRKEGSCAAITRSVYLAIRMHARNSKRSIMKGMLNE